MLIVGTQSTVMIFILQLCDCILFQGSDTWKDRDRFKKFAKASLELCKVYMEISSSTGSTKELFTADMHLKNIIRQARYLF